MLTSRKQGLAKVRRDYEVYLVYVEAERCDSCGECVKMCPDDVFEMPHKAIPVRPVNCDRPPIATSGDAALSILSQDTLQAGYRAAGAEDQYRVSTGRLAGLTPFSYAAGTIPVTRDEMVSANVVIGDFGSESALLVEAADREDVNLIAASDNLSAQSISYASAQDPLIGEELFASGAYVGAGISHEASLQVQDVLRWLVIATIVGGAIIKLIGFIF